MAIYVYKGADSMTTKDFYAMKIHIYTPNDAFFYLSLKINSPQGTCDLWEPTAGCKGESIISFSYGHISFSIWIPVCIVNFDGGFTNQIEWSIGMLLFNTADIYLAAGFWTQESKGFIFNLEFEVWKFFSTYPEWVDYIVFPSPDINGDGRVDSIDLGMVYSNLGSNPGNPACDLNGDGKINYKDLGLEFGYYLGYQTRYYTCVPPGIETTATAFGQAIKEIARKYP